MILVSHPPLPLLGSSSCHRSLLRCNDPLPNILSGAPQSHEWTVGHIRGSTWTVVVPELGLAAAGNRGLAAGATYGVRTEALGSLHKRLLYCVNVIRTSLDHLLLGKYADVDRKLSRDSIIGKFQAAVLGRDSAFAGDRQHTRSGAALPCQRSSADQTLLALSRSKG